VIHLAARKVLLVNGPNLNRLGIRNPEVYGRVTLVEVCDRVRAKLQPHGLKVLACQSNHEGVLIDFLQDNGTDCVGIIINPGALGHYGYALRDCLEDLNRPTIEVHISNVHSREPFRHTLVLSPVVSGQIVGLGVAGYELAADYLCKTMSQLTESENGGDDK
jgi:3-dehydroquinate dehydratase II